MKVELPSNAARAGSEGLAGDLSLWSVIAGNALSMVLAIALQWPLSEIMWIYWWQSVIIGAANFVRMWTLKEFSTAGLTSNDKPVPETEAGKRSTAIFFALHYGFFHVAYAVFLATLSAEEGAALNLVDIIFAATAVLGFAATHAFSLAYNRGRDFRDKKPNLGTLMFYPYLRIIPMHLTIIGGGAIAGVGVWLFMTLKTVADAGMHVVEHRLFQAPVRA